MQVKHIMRSLRERPRIVRPDLPDRYGVLHRHGFERAAQLAGLIEQAAKVVVTRPVVDVIEADDELWDHVPTLARQDRLRLPAPLSYFEFPEHNDTVNYILVAQSPHKTTEWFLVPQSLHLKISDERLDCAMWVKRPKCFADFHAFSFAADLYWLGRGVFAQRPSYGYWEHGPLDQNTYEANHAAIEDYFAKYENEMAALAARAGRLLFPLIAMVAVGAAMPHPHGRGRNRYVEVRLAK